MTNNEIIINKESEITLTDEMLEINDAIDNAAFNLIQVLCPHTLEWSMEIIAEILDATKEIMKSNEIDVYHPGITINSDGNMEYDFS